MGTLRFVVGSVGLIILTLLVVFGIAVAVGLMRVPLMDIQREGTQRTQQYVETKQTFLLALLQDYEQAEDDSGRQIAIRDRICSESTLIPNSEHPSSVAAFVSRHC